ncbi:aspartate aminotransferase family protein [Paenibacillus sp. GSMTC-2017]|uniref:class-III pyridoxal-phosphate-dependent aminotransferase n=1 Tax=Paenibacillus sp. GSMTC-2017 TaxID=2794350 RepID=UPI0018D7CD39|nr:aspartate aminotransferase family protein [Paenibacillus sp. GSMTC-2017]MBH5320320.1 aspartate aminotransferase family protein [Paenibacillus sp. GSMTC-2017]
MHLTEYYSKNLAKNTWPNLNSNPIVKGEGIYFWDTDNKKFTDFSSQTLNLLLGQCHPAIVDAIKAQAETLTYASSRFSSLPYLKAAEELVGIAPKGFNKVNIKMCDGSDANEAAVKTAKKYTGKSGIVSFVMGHTGQTTQTIQLRGYMRDPEIFRGNVEDVIFIDWPECRTQHDYLMVLEKMRSEIIKHNNVAAILVDPMMVNAGVLVNEGTGDFLKGIESICKDFGCLFILDENQSFGWLPGLFAATYYNVSPDMITMGKGLSGGHPLSGLLIKDELDGVLNYNDADFTHGGHALTCAAAIACISVLKSTDFEIEKKEELIRNRLLKLQKESAINFVYRGVGLIHGLSIEVGDREKNKSIAEIIFKHSLDAGVFFRLFENKIVLKPPVIVTEDQINSVLDVLESAFNEVTVKWS